MKNWLIVTFFFLFAAQLVQAETSSCSLPSQGTLSFYYHRIVNTDRQQLFEKCVNDYYDNLIRKMHKRNDDISDELAALKLEMKRIFPDYNPHFSQIDCQRAREPKKCSEIVAKMNGLIDEQREINGWYQTKFQPEKQEVQDKKKPTCAELPLKCPDEKANLSANQCLMEFYLLNCI